MSAQSAEKFYVTKCRLCGRNDDPEHFVGVYRSQTEAERIASRGSELWVWTKAEFDELLSKGGVIGYD